MNYAIVAIALALDFIACGAGPKRTVAGGESASWSKFQAIGHFKSDGLPTSCTSVLVGSKTMLTAAHCMGSSIQGTVNLSNQEVHRATCKVATDLDLALCRLDPEVNGILFERLGETDSLVVGSSLLLTGFGCLDEFSASADGSFGEGRATVGALPGGISNVIKLAAGVHLCARDSGGPAYLLLTSTEDGARAVVGINSQNFDVTSITTPATKAFIAQYLIENPDAPICGISQQAQGCR